MSIASWAPLFPAAPAWAPPGKEESLAKEMGGTASASPAETHGGGLPCQPAGADVADTTGAAEAKIPAAGTNALAPAAQEEEAQALVPEAASALKEPLPAALAENEEGVPVDAIDRFGNTALHKAAWLGDAACVRRLLAHGAQANARRYDGHTPLSLVQHRVLWNAAYRPSGCPPGRAGGQWSTIARLLRGDDPFEV